MNERSAPMLSTAATVALALLLSACVASHPKERRDPAQIFSSADANGDGAVTRAEFLAARSNNFAKYDRNGDGFIDAQDFPRRLRARQNVSQRLDELIDHFDADHDGRVSRAEFVDGPTSAFDLADANRDGQLSRDEIEAAANAMKSRRSTGAE